VVEWFCCKIDFKLMLMYICFKKNCYLHIKINQKKKKPKIKKDKILIFFKRKYYCVYQNIINPM